MHNACAKAEASREQQRRCGVTLFELQLKGNRSELSGFHGWREDGAVWSAWAEVQAPVLNCSGVQLKALSAWAERGCRLLVRKTERFSTLWRVSSLWTRIELVVQFVHGFQASLSVASASCCAYSRVALSGRTCSQEARRSSVCRGCGASFSRDRGAGGGGAGA